MTQHIKPYPAYKDSGLPWLGKIPVHWNVLRGKWVFNCIDIRSTTGDEELLTVSSKLGVIPRRSIKVTMFKAESYRGYKLCWPGDLVINSLWAWMQGLGFSRHHGIVSSAYGVYRAKQDYLGYWPYFDYLLRSKAYDWELRVRSKGVWTSRLQFTDESFLDMPIIVPGVEDAQKITDFLNNMNLRINRLIRAKRRLIELLNEQKQAMIHQAVTRGLDLDVPLKPSGIRWLGDVPEYWEKHKLRYIAQLLVSNIDKNLYEMEIPVRLCNYVNVYNNEFITQEVNFMAATASKMEIEKFKLQYGDVLITKDSEDWKDIGVPSLVRYEAPDLVCGYHLAILRPIKHQIIGEFLLRLLQNKIISNQFHVAANGITRYGLSQQSIKDLILYIPSINSQIEIIYYLSEKLTLLSSAIINLKSEIKLLIEFQGCLIADVVTGKLDVRGVQLPALDESDLLEDADTGEEGEAQAEEELEEIGDAED